MPTFDDLRPYAEANLPKYSFAGETPTDKMLSAFALARKWIVPLIPAGYTLSTAGADVVSDEYARQLDERRDVVRYSLAGRKDLPEDAALTAEGKGSRNYWLARYARASSGIGAFVSGAAQQAALQGRVFEGSAFTQAEYNAQVAVRTQEFSSIIDAGETGALNALVQPEAYVQSAAASAAPQNAMLASSSSMPRSTAIMIGTKGTRIRMPVQQVVQPAGGLGELATAIIIGTVVVVVFVAAILVGSAVYERIEKDRIRASSEFMGKLCSEASASKDQKTLETCRKYAEQSGAPRSMLETLGIDKIQNYLIWGGLALGAVYFLPTITKSFLSAKDIAASHQTKKGMA